MRTTTCNEHSVADLLVREKVLSKEQLLAKLGCSWMTIWRLLKAVGYLTSYNCNAGYYTLNSIPRFDDDGLWSYRKIRFSKYGTLTGTIVGLVHHSEAGLYANELKERLQVNVRATLSRLFRNGGVRRRRLRGRFLYLDSEPRRACRQFENRTAEPAPSVQPPPLPDPRKIIALLVERIKSPDVRPELIVRRLRRKGLAMSIGEARAVFEHYEISKKNA